MLLFGIRAIPYRPYEVTILVAQECQRHGDPSPVLPFENDVAVLDLNQFSNDTELAIVAAAALDDALAALLQGVLNCTQEDKDQLLHNRRFRVQLAYCFGFLDARQYADWRLVSMIRNRFAHDALPRPSFNHHRVAGLVGRLSTYREDQDNRTCFIEAAWRLERLLEEQKTLNQESE